MIEPTVTMSESEELSENTDKEAKSENPTRKRVRHRKKLLYEKILKQMEFYFGDANLSKDRFLGQLLKDDPYVPIEMFLKFNKVNALTQDPNDIAKAMKNSTLLELSEDRTKVKRKIPLLPYDADSRTVYVESIPATASREWLQRIFCEYGTVAYISLPKFKDSQRVKGYAFIEFSKPEEARKCIEMFTKMGCKLPTGTPPEELTSIKTFSAEDSANGEEVKDKAEEDEPPKKKAKKQKEKKNHKSLDLKLDEKKLDHSLEDEDVVGTPTEETKSELEFKEEPSQNGEERKARRKRGGKGKTAGVVEETARGALWGLQVLSKKEWKQLRNAYLNLQRAARKRRPRTAPIHRHGQPAVASLPVSAACGGGTDAGGGVAEGGIAGEGEAGVFVRVTMTEPCRDVRQAKRQARSDPRVLHVEVKEGHNEMTLRFDSAASASQFAMGREDCSLLSPVECAAEWSRARAARRAGRASARGAGEPGRPQPSATHIRFEEDA